MNKLIVANWKMNPATLSEALKLAKESDKRGVVIAPPFVFIEEIGRVLKKAGLGAQDVSFKSAGPHTSEVSWSELKSIGVRYVIIGHSERRALGEKDSVIGKKVKTALAHGLKVILCVGEEKQKKGIKNKELGIKEAKTFVENQLKKDLAGIRNSKFEIRNLFIAYEPVWAIGSGKNDTPEDASEMAEFIKEQATSNKKRGTRNGGRSIKVLYGGSVDSRNAKSFLEAHNIDGLLVGGASLKAGEFKKIIKTYGCDNPF